MQTPVHWFYVLYSLKDNKLYKGSCADIGQRFLSHQAGATKSTKHRRPFILIFVKQFSSKEEAIQFEYYSKTLDGGIKLRELLMQNGILNSVGSLRSAG